jgi:hypothetical protein
MMMAVTTRCWYILRGRKKHNFLEKPDVRIGQARPQDASARTDESSS